MEQIACMNHPDTPADPDIAEFGPPLCTDCAEGAVLPDTPSQAPPSDPYAVEIGARGIADAWGDSEPDDGAYDLAAAVINALVAEPHAVRALLANIEDPAGPATPWDWEAEAASCRFIAQQEAQRRTDLERGFIEITNRLRWQHNQLTGRQGNKIGRLRQELADVRALADDWHSDADRWQEDAAYWENVARQRDAEIGRLRKALAAAQTDQPHQGEVGAWLRTNFGPVRSVEHQALVLGEEVGEVHRAIVKRAQGIRGSEQHWTAELVKELADVQITLLALADSEDIDLDQATGKRWAEVRARDPHTARQSNGQPATSMTGAIHTRQAS